MLKVLTKDRGLIIPQNGKIETIWNGQDWDTGEFNFYKSAKGVKAYLTDGRKFYLPESTEIECIEGWAKISKKQRSLLPSPIGYYNALVSLEHLSYKVFDRYELGVWYARLEQAQEVDGLVNFIIPEKFYDLYEETKNLASAICPILEYTVFNSRGNYRVITLTNPEIKIPLKLSTNVTRSRDTMRGYLRGLTDFAWVVDKKLKMKTPFAEDVAILFGYFGIKTSHTKRFVAIYKSSLGRVMQFIGYRDNWQFKDLKNIESDNTIRFVSIQKVNRFYNEWEFFAFTGTKICTNGLIWRHND